LLVSLMRASLRAPGRTTGQTRFLRSPAFYILISLPYFGLCILIWRPLGINLQDGLRIFFLAAGAVIFAAGLALILWARLTLGRFYFGSTSRGAQLFIGHQLITNGPFAWIRHPMYTGMLLVGLGGVLLYQTWTMVFFALHFPGLMIRARREEDVLAAEFGQAWRDYFQRVPPWLPRIRWRSIPPAAAALLEVGLLFLPAIPAYIWFWPVASGNLKEIAQIIVYIYFTIGALWVGRRWSMSALGLNQRGIWLGLACGAVLIGARALILLGVPIQGSPHALSWGYLISQTAFYVGLVGLCEELLFRGVIYRALEDWGGTRLAIWISSVAFGLWHIFGQGALVGAATFFYGLVFALARWRAGGILGLIFAHGLMDLASVLLVSSDFTLNIQPGQENFAHPAWVIVGVVLLLALPIYLWKVHPIFIRHKPEAISPKQ